MNRWLLMSCAVLDAIISIIYLLMYNTGPDGAPTSLGWTGTAVLLSRLALAAGVCTIAAGVSARSPSLLLVLNGLAYSAFGLIPLLWRGPLGFDVFALLIVVMATTLGILAFGIARTAQHRAAGKWFFGMAAAGSIGFALAFLALANHWIPLERRAFHPAVFLWLCVYFGFTAICMFGLSLRIQKLGPDQSSEPENLSPLANPSHAN